MIWYGRCQSDWSPLVPGQCPPLHGSKGVFSYQVPANSLTIVKVAR